jgi:arylsulfatase A-like enzyme
MGKVYRDEGYQTAWIGKWHLDGHGRSSYIPPERRHGFEYWKVLECTHSYNNSFYYSGNDTTKKKWEGYDAYYQTLDAINYIKEKSRGSAPFLLVLSWGPPHNPYQTAPEESKAVFKDREIVFRDNVPEEYRQKATEDLRGYYSHAHALDKCIDTLIKSIDLAGIAESTIFIFTSDHGDMLFSHGMERKQKPYDESILVPLLIRKPGLINRAGKNISSPVSTPDLLPTMLTLCGIEIPEWIEGNDFSGLITGETEVNNHHALIMSVTPFGEWNREKGGIEYRGLRTERYTYVRNLEGPWLLFDNWKDQYQMNNLINDPGVTELRMELETKLADELKRLNDGFLPGNEYIKKWGYKVDETGTVPYRQ